MRDGLHIKRAWKWGTRGPTSAELQVWETTSPCDLGDVSVAIDTTDKMTAYIRLTPDQQKSLGKWLLGFDQDHEDPQETINELANRVIDLHTKLIAPRNPEPVYVADAEITAERGITERERDMWKDIAGMWKKLAEDYDVLTDELDAITDEQEDLLDAAETERDAWRAKVAELAVHVENLEHEVGDLQEKLRRIKGYINSIGGM